MSLKKIRLTMINELIEINKKLNFIINRNILGLKLIENSKDFAKNHEVKLKEYLIQDISALESIFLELDLLLKIDSST